MESRSAASSRAVALLSSRCTYLHALLSQLLVAFTVELDNHFELQIGQAGHPGARLSLIVWSGVVRFLAQGAISVGSLAQQAASPIDPIKFQLGCLERWGFIYFDSGGHHPLVRRDGWGSGRGIRADWTVRLAPRGIVACQIWPPLLPLIERRWEQRFGETSVNRLRRASQRILGGEPIALPDLLRAHLDAFQREFDQASPAPLVLCANTLRVLSEAPIRLSELPRLTGCSPETSDIGWQLKPYVIVTPDPSAKRGKVVALSPRGVAAQKIYRRLAAEIEKRWESRFAADVIRGLRASLADFLERRNATGLLLSQGLLPPPGTIRAGDIAPALGRRDIGAAARQRMRDSAAQTKLFVDTPAAALPHFPAWDMNRGFGP